MQEPNGQRRDFHASNGHARCGDNDTKASGRLHSHLRISPIDTPHLSTIYRETLIDLTIQSD